MNDQEIAQEEIEAGIRDLLPGCDENPLEWDRSGDYNPFHHVYQLKVSTSKGEADTTVQFLLQDTDKNEPLAFKHNGNDYSVPFFPVYEEVGLPPEIKNEPPKKWATYQIGEQRYHVVPAIIKASIGENLLTKAEVESLISPASLQQALIEFRKKVSDDPAAPTGLLHLLEDLVPEAWCDGDDEDDDWYEEEDESDDD